MFARHKPADDLKDEIRCHLRIEEQENLEAGMSPEEAHYAALQRFGNVATALEESAEMWTWSSLEDLLQDARYGLRMLRRAPGFTAVAVCTLAMGIGATTMIFGALNATLWRPIPFHNPSQLRMIWNTGSRTGGFGHASIPDYFDWKAQATVFSDLAAYSEANPAEIVTSNAHFRTRVVAISANLFATLGVTPAVGSAPASADDNVGVRDAPDRFAAPALA